MKSRSRAGAPTTVKRTVPHGRRPNAQYRTREYLTEREVERLMKAAGNNRHRHRDATMILMSFRHGLRASPLLNRPKALGGPRPSGWHQPKARLSKRVALIGAGRRLNVWRLLSGPNGSCIKRLILREGRAKLCIAGNF